MAPSICNERELAIIVATFCLEEFLQAGSEHKASDLRAPPFNNCNQLTLCIKLLYIALSETRQTRVPLTCALGLAKYKNCKQDY